MRKTNIMAWTENWSQMYSLESEAIRRVFIDELLDIYHIGSTSVPYIGYAKPIIDILVVVRDIAKVSLYSSDMAALGYSDRGERGISGRHYFTKGENNRTHHVHIYQDGNINIKKHLDFKQYLLLHPSEAQKYGELKLKLAEQFPENTHKYQEGKEAFVTQLVEKSIKWASETGGF